MYKIMLALVLLFLALMLLAMAQPAGAQQGTPPTPPPVTPPPVGGTAVDQANAAADQWDAVQQAAVTNAQAAANQAAAAAAAANAAAQQAQYAATQEKAARQAAEQGQINQATQSAQAAQLAANEALAFARDATQSASIARMQADLALRNVATLKAGLKDALTQRDAARADAAQWRDAWTTKAQDYTALAGALKAEQDQKDLYGKIAIGALALLGMVLAYVAFVLAKLLRALRVKPTDKVVVLNERGRVVAQIEGIP